MDERTILVVWFGVGVALQTFFLIRKYIRWERLGFCVLVALAATAYANYRSIPHSLGDDPLRGTALGFATFAFLVAFMFMDDILPVVTEKMLLAYSLIFWYGFATSSYHGTHGQILAVLCALPSAATVYAAFTRGLSGFWGRLLLYAWFLVIVVSLALFQFPHGSLSIFDGNMDVRWLEWLDGLVTGMACMYLIVNATYLFLLLPIPSKGQSFSDRMAEWHEMTGLMTQRCVDEGANYFQTLLLVAVVAGILLLGDVYPVLPGTMLMNVAILVAAVALNKDSRNRALQATATNGKSASAAREGAPTPGRSRR